MIILQIKQFSEQIFQMLNLNIVIVVFGCLSLLSIIKFLESMSHTIKTKNILTKLPQIMKYGSTQLSLESSMKPKIKATTSSAITVLKQVAYHHKIVSLSANQIGLDERVFVVLKPNIMKPGKWRQYQQIFQKVGLNSAEEGYEAIINPIQINSCYDTYLGYEECPSFPGLKFMVKMPIFSNIKYMTESTLADHLKTEGQKKSYEIKDSLYIEQKIMGWKGRVWDHQIRHLQGVLPIQQKLCEGKFYLLDDYKSQISNIEYYQDLIQIESNYKQDNLKKLRKQTQKQINNKKKAGSVQSFIKLPDQLLAKNKEVKKQIKPPSSKKSSKIK